MGTAFLTIVAKSLGRSVPTLALVIGWLLFAGYLGVWEWLRIGMACLIAIVVFNLIDRMIV